MIENESIRILDECKQMQLKKGQDYQNPESSVTQADYFPRGITSIYEIMNAKMLRIKSIMEIKEKYPSHQENYEGLEDSAKDLINYSSFFVSWLRGQVPGQKVNSGLFNSKSPVSNSKPINSHQTSSISFNKEG